ncbi:MAG: HTH domain-containing protein, partial [Desulfuromonadales bacterium]|nr:HTH domain-containing protein [Desulfuromonadales bacterium]
YPIAYAAKKLNVSRTTVYNYLDQLEDKGRIRRNGNGIEVLEK